jgi:sugar phosphate isomerase/epimerase
MMNSNNLALQLGAFRLPTADEAIQAAHALGVGAVGFAGAPVPMIEGKPLYSFLWDELKPARQEALRATRRAFGRGVIHAPFVDTPLVSSNPYIERESHRQMLMAVAAAKALELEAVTVHAGLPAKNMTMAEFRNRLVNVLQSLGEAAATANTRICLENWRYPCDPTEHLHILEMVDHPNVGATLDVGHISYWFQHEGVTGLHSAAELADYHRRVYQFIDTLGQRIVHVHMHDVRAADLADHRGIGRGFLDIDNIIAALHQVAFDGVILFEIAEPDFAVAAAESVQRLQQAMAALDQQLLSKERI